MKEITETLMHKWFTEVWNNGDESAIDRMMISEGEARGIEGASGIPDIEQPRGPEGFKIFFNSFRSAYSDIHIDVEQVVSEDDFEVGRLMVNATHIETGKPVKFAGMCMIKKSGSRIAEAWNNFDFLTMYQQQGKSLV